MSDEPEIESSDQQIAPAARLVAATLRAANIVLAGSAQDVDFNANRLACLFRKISTDTSAEAVRLVALQDHVSDGGEGSDRMGLTHLPAVMDSCLMSLREDIASISDQQITLKSTVSQLQDQVADLAYYQTEITTVSEQAKQIADAALTARQSVEDTAPIQESRGAQNVSQGMRRLAARAERVSERVQACQKNLDNKLGALSEKIDSDHKALLDQGQNKTHEQFSSRARLTAFLDTVKQRDRATAASLESACLSAQQFSQDIDSYLNSMHFQDELTDRFSSVIQALVSILELVEISEISSSGSKSLTGDVEEIIGNINNSEVRERFYRSVLSTGDGSALG
jgi:hypothetical protein